MWYKSHYDECFDQWFKLKKSNIQCLHKVQIFLALESVKFSFINFQRLQNDSRISDFEFNINFKDEVILCLYELDYKWDKYLGLLAVFGLQRTDAKSSDAFFGDYFKFSRFYSN